MGGRAGCNRGDRRSGKVYVMQSRGNASAAVPDCVNRHADDQDLGGDQHPDD